VAEIPSQQPSERGLSVTREPPRVFKDVLRQHRIAADLTQEELAEQAGLSTRAISDLERGVKQHPRKDTAQMLADGLGLEGPEREAFLAVARRPVAGAPPVSFAAPRRYEVPPPPAPLVGRAREIAAAGELLGQSEARLVTLTGPGGVGKTSLAMQIAQEVSEHFPDGMVLVDLAPLADPALLLPTVARALDVRETAEQPLAEALAAELADKRLLLVLDNFEHLVAAAPDVARLLAACPRLRMLVTSRVALQIRAEHEFPVLPLAVPQPGPHDLDDLRDNPAVALFVQRAEAINARFDPDDATLGAVGTICQRLDGLPLAIELVAARTRGLTPTDILARLDQRLDLLTGGARDLPARQQTMRAAIGWSYDLLEPAEQALFGRLSVCVGGFSLGLAEALGDALDEPVDALAIVESLLARSLLQRDEGATDTRFGMLETIRAFAQERLAASSEEDAARRAHAAYFFDLFEAAPPDLAGAAQSVWLDQIEREHDNLRSALERWIGNGTDEALRVVAKLWWFWWVRGYLAEGRSWLARALAAGAEAPPVVKARVLIGAGTLAESQGDYEQAVALHEEALAIYRSLDDRPGMSKALESLGSIAQDRGDYAGATAYHQEALSLSTVGNDRQGIAHALLNLGSVAAYQGLDEQAVALKTEALGLLGELADQRGIAAALTDLGTLAFRADDLETATARYQEALVHWQQLGDKQGMALVLDGLGETEQRRGQLDEAHQLFARARPLFEELGDRRGLAVVYTAMAQLERLKGNVPEAVGFLGDSLQIVHALADREAIAGNLEELARLAGVRGWHEPAARMMGAAQALREEVGAPPAAIDQRELEGWATTTREALGSAAFQQATAAGRDAVRHDLLPETMALVDRLRQD
jgi:predicted ATPase/transcriptional regulator with XRE-family HTH domain